MGPAWYIYGSSGHGFYLGTHIWVLHITCMGQVGMGLICEHIHGSCVTYLYRLSGHGFELGTHIWVMHDAFMGQVDMCLV